METAGFGVGMSFGAAIDESMRAASAAADADETAGTANVLM